MGTKCVAAVLMILLSAVVKGQTNVPDVSDTTVSHTLSGSHDELMTQRPTPSNQSGRCCSRKGALIGLAIGAGVGGLVVYYSCDYDCASTTAKAVAVLGGIGAGVGALISMSNRQGAVGLPISTRLRVSPELARARKGASVRLRF
jgi:hypothetical protein